MRRLARALALLVAVGVAACRPGAAAPPAPPRPATQTWHDGTASMPPSVLTPATIPTAAPSLAPATTPPERFVGTVSRVDATLRATLIGRNWHPGCPVPIRDLRLVTVSYRNVGGDVRSGPLVVHEDVADDVVAVFRRLFHAGFPIHRIGLPPAYRPPVPADRSNRRNLTSSFNCRPATGSPGSLSHHSYGWAIDINPLQNPYVLADGTVLRDAVEQYVDRSRRRPGMIHDGDVVVRSFARIGWGWGGHWDTLKDYMHFSLTGR